MFEWCAMGRAEQTDTPTVFKRWAVRLGGVLLILTLACSPAAAPAPPTAAPAPAPTTAAPAAGPTSVPAAAPTSAAGSTTTSTTPLKVMTQQLGTDVALYIAQERGYFKDQGLDVQFQIINQGSQAIPLVSTGQLDVAVGAVSAALFNAAARGTGIRMVGEKGAVSPDPGNGFSSLTWFVAAKAQADAIKSGKDLKGKKFALSDPGSATGIILDKLLSQAGLQQSDVTTTILSFPDMVAGLSNNAVDAGIENEPFVAQGVANGSLVTVQNVSQISPGDQSAVVIFGPTMSQEVGNRFMVAYTRALRDYNEAIGPKQHGREDVIAMLIKYTTIKDRALYDKMAWQYMNPNCSVNARAVSDDLDWYMANGFVQERPDLTKALDDSFCQAAVKELGPYTP
jgi:NitT/TauT family transport system substrate-binding protein